MSIEQTESVKQYLDLLRGRVSAKTAAHCVAAAELMAVHADAMGIDREPAITAGLLHDLCKGMPGPELLAAAARYAIPVGETQRAHPGLLHGPVAAEECRRDLGVDDAIYEAIYWHTTGRPDWNRLGLAVYFADFAEPLRRHREAADARSIFETHGFGAALRFVAEKKFEHVRTRPHVDPITEAFYAWLEAAPL